MQKEREDVFLFIILHGETHLETRSKFIRPAPLGIPNRKESNKASIKRQNQRLTAKAAAQGDNQVQSPPCDKASVEVKASSFQITPHKAQETQLGGVNESETDKRERNPITSGAGSGISGQIFLSTSTRIQRRKAAIATRSRKEETGGRE
jgi:hypothetical protein